MTIKELVEQIPKSTIIKIHYIDGTESKEYFYWRSLQEDEKHCCLVLVDLSNDTIIYKFVWFDKSNDINGISIVREVYEKEHDNITIKFEDNLA